MKTNERHGYVTVIASLYLVLCSISIVRYALIYFGDRAGTVPVTVQLLCLGMALAAGAYFVKARAGHIGLIVLTVATLVSIGTTNLKATFFHLVILCLLILPFIRRGALKADGRGSGAGPDGGGSGQFGNSGITAGPPSVS